MQVSPYIEREGRRLGLIIGTRADVRPEHYLFARQQRLYTPRLQKTKPVAPAWHDWACGFLVTFAIACILFVTV